MLGARPPAPARAAEQQQAQDPQRKPVPLAGIDPRSLSFHHTHTGERLSVVYYANGALQPAALTRINRILRDFRTGDVLPIDPQLLDLLFELQARAAHDGPFEVISAYRSARTNENLRSHSNGVSEHSYHLLGRAIDIRLPGYSTLQLGVLARDMRRGGVGYYRSSDFVHVDTGPVRIWGDPLIGQAVGPLSR